MTNYCIPLPHEVVAGLKNATVLKGHRTIGYAMAVILLGTVLALHSGSSVPSAHAETPALFTLTASPQVAVAGDRVTISVMPINFAASTTVFTWFKNGVGIAAASGLNKSSFLLATNPAAEETVQLKVSADPGPDFAAGEQSLTIATLPGPVQQRQLLEEISSNFTLQTSNTNPNPGESVRMEVVTSGFDTVTADYQWYVNGVFDRPDSGRGRSRITFPAPAESTAATVRVDVTTAEGATRSKSAVIETASVPLYWWADTTVPYWYKGKALPSLRSRVTVLALPHGRNAADLAFQWRFNDSVVQVASGVGRSTFAFTLHFAVAERVDVVVSDLAATLTKTVGVAIAPTPATVSLFEVRPLRGVIAAHELAEFTAPAGDPYDFRASPFFFPKDREAAIGYTWTLNGETVSGLFTKPWLFTLKSRLGEASDNRLAVEVADSSRDAERAAAALQARLR